MDTSWNVKGIIERAVWTFVQAAVGAISVVAVQAAILGVDLPALRAIGLTALAAGIAGVLSLAKNLTAEGIVVQVTKRTQAAPLESSWSMAFGPGAASVGPSSNTAGPLAPNERQMRARLATDDGSQPTKRAPKKS